MVMPWPSTPPSKERTNEVVFLPIKEIEKGMHPGNPEPWSDLTQSILDAIREENWGSIVSSPQARPGAPCLVFKAWGF
jgi:hypothetical protein